MVSAARTLYFDVSYSLVVNIFYLLQMRVKTPVTTPLSCSFLWKESSPPASVSLSRTFFYAVTHL